MVLKLFQATNWINLQFSKIKHSIFIWRNLFGIVILVIYINDILSSAIGNSKKERYLE